MVNNDFALLYGTLLGDGCLSSCGKGSFVVITCGYSDEEFFNFIVPKIEKIRGKKVKVYRRPDYGKIEINFSDKLLFNKFKEMGFPVGKKGTELKIPQNLLNSMREIIKGYFATDGCLVLTNNNGISYPRLEFSSISKTLLIQVKEYLSSIGIVGQIYLSKKYNNHWNDLYRLQINGKDKLFLFQKKIGFVNPKHQVKFEKYTTIL
ncbi:hypothetical protein GOV03_03710 [Candidatus Woesearchaeota archaeon]|nr:hypothetical protein [Candidatus Woesearchaeota archaeon]